MPVTTMVELAASVPAGIVSESVEVANAVPVVVTVVSVVLMRVYFGGPDHERAPVPSLLSTPAACVLGATYATPLSESLCAEFAAIVVVPYDATKLLMVVEATVLVARVVVPFNV